MPLGARYKEKKLWEPVIDMFESRLAGWKRNFLSKGCKLTLIKSTFANLPVYYLSTLTISVSVAKHWRPFNVVSYGAIVEIEKSFILSNGTK